jgi:hypothetical protein
MPRSLPRGSLFFTGRYVAQTDPEIGGSHGRIERLKGIVSQDIDIGYVPAMTWIFYLRIPPSVLCNNHPWVDVAV